MPNRLKSPKVRGLLHYKCNLGIGYMKDSAILLRNAGMYLETMPNGSASH